MKYLPLIWKDLTRRKVRTAFTLLSILVAFVLFVYLAAIGKAFSLGVDLTGEDRLVVIHKTSLILQLPIAYEHRLETIPGVVEAAHATWFGGMFQDEEDRFPVFPVIGEEFLSLYSEYLLPEDQLKAWLEDRTGAVVGRATAERYGFEIGDRIPIQGTIYRKADGTDTWEFNVRGIYDGAETGVDETLFLFHYEFFNEARDIEKDMIGWFTVRIDEPERAAEIARKIDENFANSSYETETTTEKAFIQSFAKQIGDVGQILRLILTAVFITMLLVAGNTMGQSVRERINELAVLKTLGFSDAKVLTLVLAESLFLTLVGGGLGLGLGWLAVQSGDPTQGRLPAFYVPGSDLALGFLLMIFFGVIAGIFPALQAMRLRIADALRSA